MRKDNYIVEKCPGNKYMIDLYETIDGIDRLIYCGNHEPKDEVYRY